MEQGLHFRLKVQLYHCLRYAVRNCAGKPGQERPLVASKTSGKPITKLSLSDLTCDLVLGFLKAMEQARSNSVRTRNQRLAAIHTFYKYLASHVPEMISEGQRVAAIPTKRTPPPETIFLDQDEIQNLFAHLPHNRRSSLRDRVLLLFLYNTGARVQEVADLRVENLDLGTQPRVRLHGKGDQWRICPLWRETAESLKLLVDGAPDKNSVFVSTTGNPLTRFGIYKIVRRVSANIANASPRKKNISPHEAWARQLGYNKSICRNQYPDEN